MSNQDEWSRLRASILPSTQLLGFFYCFGMFNDLANGPGDDDYDDAMLKLIIALIWIIPGGIAGIAIYYKTKATEAPDWLLTVFSVLAFAQSIAWINLASDSITDLLKIFGFILSLPQALLSLTVLAWGICLSDMSVDVAMTRKGFGEMAMTATVAGPIFNVLIG